MLLVHARPCLHALWAHCIHCILHGVKFSFRMCRCLAQLALDTSDDIYFVVAFLDEIAFVQKYPRYRIRPHMLGVVLVSYCSAGDGGALATLCHYPPPPALSESLGSLYQYGH